MKILQNPNLTNSSIIEQIWKSIYRDWWWRTKVWQGRKLKLFKWFYWNYKSYS